MSDDASHKSRPHTAVHCDPATGQIHVLRADNTADGLRLALAKAVEEYGIAGRVEYTVQALDGPWVRLEVRYIGEWDVDDYCGFPTDVEKAMQGLPHGYYEVRERGQNQDRTHVWFVARHEYGPLI
jgi:hypothetical protein